MLDLNARQEIEALRVVAPIKTWSLLVTVFGDLQATSEQPLSGAFLNGLFREMGIKPEALRVALHRLAKDGWITSKKTGRTSVYFLAEKGVQETNSVQQRVYTPFPDGLSDWACVLVNGSGPAAEVPLVQLGPDVFAVPRAYLLAIPDAVTMDFAMQAAPPWIDEKCLSPELRQALARLQDALRQLDIGRIGASTKVRLPLRMLTLHHWRRLALRDGFWFHHHLVPGGAPRQCQTAVLDLLNALPIREDDRALFEDL
ncbi:MAG: hypothetical protein AAF557_12095 [Pseudomonadota bacterium]